MPSDAFNQIKRPFPFAVEWLASVHSPVPIRRIPDGLLVGAGDASLVADDSPEVFIVQTGRN